MLLNKFFFNLQFKISLNLASNPLQSPYKLVPGQPQRTLKRLRAFHLPCKYFIITKNRYNKQKDKKGENLPKEKLYFVNKNENIKFEIKFTLPISIKLFVFNNFVA